MLGKTLKVLLPVVAIASLIALMIIASGDATLPILNTRGVVGDAERDTLLLAVGIMLLIVIPVFCLLLFIAVRYRDTNKRAKYSPDWAHNSTLEAVWWGFPILIVIVLSVVAWQTSHSLDPYRALDSTKTPIQVQVVSLEWKWLFIYPELDVASVGEFAMPIDTPVTFTITSDAPMNSFWIPQLGGQIYAMSGMSTTLHLSARETGDYRGVSANLSGEGHSSMTFTAKARSDKEFSAWVSQAHASSERLDTTTYETLRLPSRNDAVRYYQLADKELYSGIIQRYSGSHTMNMTTAEARY